MDKQIRNLGALPSWSGLAAFGSESLAAPMGLGDFATLAQFLNRRGKAALAVSIEASWPKVSPAASLVGVLPLYSDWQFGSKKTQRLGGFESGVDSGSSRRSVVLSDAEDEESVLLQQRRRARRLRRANGKKWQVHGAAHHDHSSHAHDEDEGCGPEKERSGRIRRRRKKKGEVASDQAVAEEPGFEVPSLSDSDSSAPDSQLSSNLSGSVPAQQVAFVNLKPAADGETSADVSTGPAPASEAAVAESAGAVTAGTEMAVDMGGVTADAAGGAPENASVEPGTETSADVSSESDADVSGSAENAVSQAAYNSTSEDTSHSVPGVQHLSLGSSDSLMEDGVSVDFYSYSEKTSLSDLLGMTAISSFGHEVGHPSVRRFAETRLGDAGSVSWPQLNQVMGISTSIYQGLVEDHSLHRQSLLESSVGDVFVE